MSEGDVVNACIRLLLLWQCEAHRNNSGGLKDANGRWVRFGKKGSGDILACSPHGRWVEIECKWGRNEASDDQLARADIIRSKGGIFLFVRNNTEELEKHKDRILAIPTWSHP